MLIPEAVQLVLHAAALARGRDVYVLEMGEQIKVLDMVKNLIRLSGFIPGEDIPITFVGVRPGEKLYEELIASDEIVEPSGVPQILRIRPVSNTAPTVLQSQLLELEQLAIKGNAEALIKLLQEMVPTYRPDAGCLNGNGGKNDEEPTVLVPASQPAVAPMVVDRHP